MQGLGTRLPVEQACRAANDEVTRGLPRGGPWDRECLVFRERLESTSRLNQNLLAVSCLKSIRARKSSSTQIKCHGKVSRVVKSRAFVPDG